MGGRPIKSKSKNSSTPEIAIKNGSVGRRSTKRKTKKRSEEDEEPCVPVEGEESSSENFNHLDEEEEEQNRIALTSSGLVFVREEIVQKVCDALKVEKPVAQRLLSGLGWDPQVVIEKYLDNPDEVLLETGIDVEVKNDEEEPKKSKKSKRPYKIIKEKSEKECTICMDETVDFAALNCDHAVCTNCWKDHLELSITDGKTFDISCPWNECKKLVPDELVKKLAKEETYEKYCNFMSSKMVDSSKVQKWCVRKGCGKAIVEPMSEGNSLVGKCSCGIIFCWSCSREAHAPATCEQIEKWGAGTSIGEVENLKWISENTKGCIKCKNRVEKQGGCFQMTCRCGYQFCWLCGQPWYTHTDHFACSTYPEAGRPEVVGNSVVYKEQITTSEDRVKQFQDVEKEMKDAEVLIKQIEAKTELLRNDALLFDDTPLVKAQQQIKTLRRLTKYTIVRRIYEDVEVEQSHLTNHQKSLQAATKRLALLVEDTYVNVQPKDFDAKLVQDIKKKTTEAVNVANNIMSDWSRLFV